MIALGLRNLVKPTTTITGSGWNAALPVTNMRLRDMSKVARSVSSSPNTAEFVVDHGSAKTARVMMMMGTNLTSQATITWNRGTTSGGSQVYAGSPVNAWSISLETYNGRAYGTTMIVTETATSARYDEIIITDPGNPGGYIEIGRIWISDLWIPQFGAVHPLSDTVQDLSQVDRSDGGNLWVTKRRKLRSVQFVLQALTIDESNTLHALMMDSGITEEVLYMPKLGDNAYNQHFGYIATMQELSALEYPFPKRKSLPLRLTEIA